MPNQRKRLGTDLERAVVNRAKARNIPARRQPLSGQTKDFPGDVVLGERILGECKVRTVQVTPRGKRIFSLDLDWLADVEEKARRAGYAGAVVFLRPKNSARLLVLAGEEVFWPVLTNTSEALDTNESGGRMKASA